MKFRNEKILCSKCKREIDGLVSNCPYCNHENLYSLTAPGSKNIFWIDTVRQIFIFLIGFIGFALFSGLISVFLSLIISLTSDTVEEAQALLKSDQILFCLNLLSYMFALVAITIVLYPYLNNLFKQFLKYKKLLIGLGFGVMLILASIVYGTLINMIPAIKDVPSNQNQEAVSRMVLTFPVPSILLFGIVGPFVEECTYRLGLFSLLNRKNRICAYLISIFVFALIHFNFSAGNADAYIVELINLPSYIIGGLLLAVAYEKSGFAGSFVAHLTNNMYSIIMILLASSLGLN